MAKLLKSQKDILKEFRDGTSIHSCNFFTMKNVIKSERILWAILNILLVIITIYLIHLLWWEYSDNPTVTTFASAYLPIQKVKYPGVSVCNINKISKRRAYEFAEYLNKFIKGKNISNIMEDIKLLGSFYNYNFDARKPFSEFQDILDMYDNSTSESDITRRLLYLTTPCKDILRKCEWGGKLYPCEELFFTRVTFDGFCCVFNYVRPLRNHNMYRNINLLEAPKVSKVPQSYGVENSLQVTLVNDLDDYFYSVMETSGFNIHIFYPEDFPDKLSGSLTEIFVNENVEALINIDVDVVYSSPEIQMLPISMRKCIFENEKTTFFGTYRESDCYVDCRMKSIASLCNCIPFTIPVSPASLDGVSRCNLHDIPCLNKYKGKWLKYYPHGAENYFRHENYDSISCKQCLPPCNNVQYIVRTDLSTINVPKRNSSSISRISIFFSNAFCNLYKIDLTSTWFEELSSFGGMLSLFIGLSLISVVEICVLGCKIIGYCVLKGLSQK